MHLVGDVHQPLHAADHQDRGGNDVHVSAAFAKAGNLHNYWDTIFVSRLGRGSAEAAAELIAGISAEQSRSWSMGTAVDWAWQSYQIAKTQAYGKLPRSNARAELDLDEAYVANATDTVRLQLQRAGVRLAWLLNTALR